MASTASAVAFIVSILLQHLPASTEQSPTTVSGEKQPTIEQILETYVQDFRSDRYAAQQRTFGVRVPGVGEWHILVTGKKTSDQWDVQLQSGASPAPTFVYQIEAETLRAIDRGDMNALTAQGKAFASDPSPMSVVKMDGYEPSPAEDAEINPFSFHFWTRGFPEVIPFGSGLTRRAHGSNVGALYYQQGLRTAWYCVEPGDRVREDPREKAMPFPILAVVIEGTATGEIDGAPIQLTAGQAVFIPPHVHHRWWNETDRPAQAILIMFGEGA